MLAHISSYSSIFKLKYTPTLALLFLTACGGGPSASDIKTALQTASNGLMGPGAVLIEDVTNVSCKEAQGKSGYVCLFTAAVQNNMTRSRAEQTSEARFVPAGSGWAMMNDK